MTEAPSGDPPITLPREIDSAGYVSPTFIRRKVLRAELKEIERSRRLRDLPDEAVNDLEAGLERITERAPEEPTAHEASRFLRSWPASIRDHFLNQARKKAAERREWNWNEAPILPPDCGSVGLALSGGGIRSATLCLGILQAFANANVLRLVDYLSTVSGGGYIGACWSGIMARSPDHRELVANPDFPFCHAADSHGQFIEASRQIQNKEPIALVHVRDFANYLMPRGLRDQIRVPALLLRGLTINLLLLLPTILVFSAIALWVYGDAIAEHSVEELPGFQATPWLIGICLGYMLFATAIQAWRGWSSVRHVVDFVFGRPERNGWRVRRNLLKCGSNLLLLLALVAAFEATQYPLAWLARSEAEAGRLARASSTERPDAAAEPAIGTGSLPLAAREILPAAGPDRESAAVAPRATDAESDGALSLFESAQFWAVLGAVVGLVSALVAGQAAGSHSWRTRKIAFAVAGIAGPLGLLTIYLWIAATLCIFAIYDFGLLPRLSDVVGREWIGPVHLGDPDVWGAIYILAALAIWIGMHLIVDINKTSLHNFYRDRLSRAFMFRIEPVPESAGAGSKPQAWRTRHEDEIAISELRPSKTGGPYHLINAIVNNPDFSEDDRIGTETQRGRRADFFVFSAGYCGNERLGYCRTRELERVDPHMNLASAMAISAAAAAPNMGQKTFNPLLVFLMSMLNIRLGYWMRKPESVEHVDRLRWPVGPLYFMGELMGLSLRSSSYINLSDGGHLDNTGIFELLRRRCRYIIAIDAEADPKMQFNGLATLQRLARIDLGVEIHFDVEDLRRDATGLSRRHIALCDITYPSDAEGRPSTRGKLLCIKSSLTGTEIEYVKEYWADHPDFPHETTGDQFFDEAQFEAYRALGSKMGREVVDRAEPADLTTADAFFNHLEHWLQPISPLERGIADLANRRRSIHERFRMDSLANYRNEIWPPYDNGPEMQETAARSARCCEPLWQAGETPDPQILQLTNEQIQLMELALLQLRFDDPTNWHHPRNRGWREMFGRWSQSTTFRKYWQLSIPYYSHGLEAFGVNVLQLPEPPEQRARSA